MPDSRPSDLAARLRGAATAPAAAPRPAAPRAARPAALAAADKPARTKYTMLLTDADASDLDGVVELLRRQLGRRRVDRSEVLRGLVRLARRDLSLMAALAEELTGPAAG
jgi:hypothetical protein